ncbi:7-deoxyloganetin glucosyltransferase-like [Telopea speciosissima]|uniref:7-deoxyloganetin glucosyltransferase-like n=1 Tax=Telopea speciosissima TaxID=54955 RepID=UPI001CC5A04E|nr:7-deoxyloganetin glucosyltransferase-like [Telopea speciosissima]
MGSFGGGQINNKPHAVCIPFPAQGHVNPMMQLAKLLHSRGFHITFVNTEFNHRRLLRSKAPDALKGFTDFQFETIPDGLPSSDRDATQDVPTLCDSVGKNCLAPFRDLLKKLNSSSSSTTVPQVSCIVSDAVMSFSIKAARELGIPEVQFWTASACGFMGYLHFDELIKRGIVPLKDEKDISNGYLDTPIDWIPGMKDMRLKDVPSFIRTTDPNDIMLNYLGQEAQNSLKAPAIILNTFDDLEHEVLGAIASKFPHIYTIGPLKFLGQCISETESIPSSLWKEDFNCLEWLDKKEPNSVVYVNFGSITVMSDQHFREFAWGLANCKYPFLWINRPDVVMGEESAILPEEFIEETKDRGLVVSWCPQDKVLLHSSIGGFLTHCGWNSTIESICGGVPMLCWPFFAEQQTNCRYACTHWGIGLEINNDLKREEVETLVKELMEGERGKVMRKKTLDWKEKAEAATKQGGSSYNNFDKVIKEVLHPIK